MKESRYFYVPDPVSQPELPMEEGMHALRVLRLKSGDEMFLMDGLGKVYRAEVTLAATKRCVYEIKETIEVPKTWRGRIHLAIAPTKMLDRIEWLAEKATEVGFDELTFLNCKFSERKVMRTVRLEKIIISALKQSRKSWKPVINSMLQFRDFIKRPRQGRKFIAHCYDGIPREDFFEALQGTGDEEVTVLIGPEGDFSPEEVQMAQEAGYVSVSLGKSRLRTETAGLAAVMMSQLVLREK
ncbi:MAG: 16S rRNA (uracil(1498)-N(3))-methyltransferase [Prevotella sp.]